MGVKVAEVREKYLSFFEKQDHKRINPAPLVLENDPTTLFTSSGMQPLVPYLMGEPYKDEKGKVIKRLVDSQPSLRTVDIDEVGDNRHLTFFEMLGNWSLGDYFKTEQLSWILEFFTKELGLSRKKLWATAFEGNKQVPKDTESVEIWKKLGIPESRIFFCDATRNWWSRTGMPEQMPTGEIGGPDSEVFYDFGEELGLHQNSPFKNEKCHPNCECGRFLEIGNSVFMQYKKVGEGKLEELPQKNVDFGGGLERIAAAVNGDPDIYKTDLFYSLIKIIGKDTKSSYANYTNNFRIIADHIKASTFLIAAGIRPSNKGHGYVLRRLLRRSTIKMNEISGDLMPILTFQLLTDEVMNIYGREYLSPKEYKHIVDEVINDEMSKFGKTLDNGLKILRKEERVDGKTIFDLYQTYGFPPELTLEIAVKENIKVDGKAAIDLEKEIEAHKEQSRTTSAGVFKGGLADHSPEVIRLHTATHLLLASLRKVLGPQVVQKGQNITKERSRFDFPNSEKLSDEQIRKVEDMINDVIERDLPINYKVMPKEEALKTGAIHAFNEKYADTVKVYFVGKDIKSAFSKEFCGGPHVNRTGEIGRVRIKKQEKIGSGLMRIYLVLTIADKKF
jgi:alanyl-tRNA synthetase